jgi:WD40 repeat protein
MQMVRRPYGTLNDTGVSMMTKGTTRVPKFQYRFITLFLLILLLFQSPPVRAEGIFVSAPSRIDMVYDSTCDILYITNGDSVLRYHLTSGTFLTPFQLGGNLKGIDLSPDGNTLAVADDERTETEVWIHLVDLNTGQDSQVFFSRAFGEGGTFTVAYAGDGTIFISSTFEGSGWVPLRRYNPVSDTTTTLASVSQNTMLVSSADGNTIAFAENNISDGRWGIYDLPTETLTQRQGYDDGTGWFNYEIGVNRFGTQYAIPTYGGTYIYDATFQHVNTIGQYASQQPVGVVYHPTGCSVYFAWAGTSQVRSHDTRTFSQIATYDFEYTFSHTGNYAFTQGRLRISRDGTLLMATVGGGVRVVRVDGELRCKAYLPLIVN